ncbi:MAG: sodium:alanine symporter family protein, partial [Clostridia bacterium]|nr:sodium:alanine symporter family protein [Clostridia bacterium]
MDAFIETVTDVNKVIYDFVWVKIGLFLLIATGILMTVCTKVFQVSHLGLWWKNTIGSLFTKRVMSHSKEKGSISPFQALCTALAAPIGTGTIAGVATALCVG